MRFAYTDPPYPGRCHLYNHNHPDGKCWDDFGTTHLLIARLQVEFPDGWALSTHADSLQKVLSVCPAGVRVLVWSKQLAVPRKTRIQFFWEPVVLSGGRPFENEDSLTIRDVLVAQPPANHLRVKPEKTFVIGMKPRRFAHWIFDCLGARPGDELHDLFSGSGVISREWDAYERQGRLIA